MTFNEWIEDLETCARNEDVFSKDLIKKYRKRYDLGIEAGFSEDDILRKFGSVESIIKSLKGEGVSDEKAQRMSIFRIDASDDVSIRFIPGKYIVCSIDERIAKYYSVTNTQDRFIIEHDDNIKSMRKLCGDISVSIGTDIVFDRFEINSSSSDINVESGRIVATSININNLSGDMIFRSALNAKESIKINNVSGDFILEKVVSEKMSIDNVSGDIAVRDALIKNLFAESISGDISIYGTIGAWKCNTVSAEVLINGEVACASLINKFKNFFSGNKRRDDKNASE